MTTYELPEGMTAERLRELAEDMEQRSGWSIDAEMVRDWATAIDPPEPAPVVTAEMVEAFISEYRRAGRFADTAMARDALEAVERLGWLRALDGGECHIIERGREDEYYVEADFADLDTILDELRGLRVENEHILKQNNELRKRVHDLESAPDNPSPSTEPWPTDEMLDAAAKALFQLAPVFKLDYWRGVARIALEAVAPPPADDRVRAAVMEGERRISEITDRLEMAEGLLRRAHQCINVSRRCYLALGYLDIRNDEADYLRSLDGEGE